MRDATAWMQAHDRTIELTAVWVLVVAFGVYALVKLISWWTLRQSVDQTDVGRTLKPQKLSEALMGAGMASLYGISLWAYYEHHEFGVWSKFVIRSAVVAGVVIASVAGVRFVLALRRETREAGP